MGNTRVVVLGLLLVAPLVLSCAEATSVRLCTTRAECGGDVCINGRCEPFDAGQDAPDQPDATSDGVTTDAFVNDSSLPVFDSGALDIGPSPDAFVPGACGASPCGMWVLEDGAPTWDPSAAPGGSARPSSAIRAAFDIESRGIAYVLTDSTVHTLRLSDRVYVESSPRRGVFPELTGVLRTASSVPAGHAGSDPSVEAVTLMSDDGAFVYQYSFSTGAFSYVRTATDLGPEWDTAEAPSLSAVRASWLALEDDDRWTTGSPMASCGVPGSRFVVYLAFLSSSAVHIFDAGHCSRFVQRTSYVTFPPFTRGGAPDISSVAAAFYNAGNLWLLAE